MTRTHSSAGYNFSKPATIRRLDRIIEILRSSPDGLTRLELAAAVHIGPSRMKCYLQALRGIVVGMPRMVRVTSWRRQLGSGGSPEAVFAIGTSADAHRPTPMTRQQITKRRAKRLANDEPEQWLDLREAKRAADARRRGTKPRRDRMTAALYGAAA